MNNASNNDEIYKIFTEGNPLSNEDPIVILPVAVSINNTDLIDAINISIMSENHFGGFVEPLENLRFSVQAAQNRDSISRIFFENPMSNERIFIDEHLVNDTNISMYNDNPIHYRRYFYNFIIIIFLITATVIISIVVYFFYG